MTDEHHPSQDHPSPAHQDAAVHVHQAADAHASLERPTPSTGESMSARKSPQGVADASPAQGGTTAGSLPRMPLPAGYQLLSQTLSDIPAEELHLVLDHYEDAVMRGTIKALPLEGAEPFQLPVVNHQGKRVNRRIEEEIVIPDDAFEQWLKAERRASRLAVLAVTGRVETSLEKLTSGDDDFSKLLDIRRKRLQKSKAPNRPPKSSS